MKLTLMLLTATLCAVASNGVSQSITFTARNASPEEIISVVKQQAKFVFIYDEEMLRNGKRINIAARDMPVQEFLTRAFRDQPFTWSIQNQTVILEERPFTASGEDPAKDLYRLLLPPPVTGRVVIDESGDPIAGASVRIAKTNRGTATDKNGEFTINAEPGQTLLISFVGFEEKEVRITEHTRSITVRLVRTSQSMKDIVVTGIFNRRLESFTGAAASFTKDELLKAGNQNVLQSLRNLDPSFRITENLDLGSNPNRMPDIQLRGTSSLPDLKGEYQSNPNQPLFILDGFQSSIEKIYDLDMNRVRSVTLLKDAAAKAIYGARAANGVVVIETILPQSGKLRVSYTGKIDITAPDLTSYHLTDAAQKLQAELDAGLYTSSNPDIQYIFTQQYNDRLREVLSGTNTYWLSQPLQTGIGQKHSLYLEGGDQSLRYGIDFAYNKLTGVMKGSGREVLSGAATISYRYKNLLFRNVLLVNFNKADNSPYGSFSEYTRQNPYYRIKDENGNILKELGALSDRTVSQNGAYTNGLTYYNPLYNGLINTKDISRYTDVTNNFYVEWGILPSLRMIGRLGVTQKNKGTEVFYPAEHTMFINYTSDDDFFRRGQYSKSDGVEKQLQSDLSLQYSKRIDNHQLFLNGTANLSDQSDQLSGYVAEGFPNDRIDFIAFGRQYQLNGKPSGMEDRSREIGLLGSLNYSYDDRFLMDLSYRGSASSKFGKNNRWGGFWSVGVGWNLHHEKLFSTQEYIDQFRIRSSYGHTGSQSFNSYQALSSYRYILDKSYNGAIGAYLAALPNEDLKWQKRNDFNAGLDLGLFKRLNLRFDYYYGTTDNLLTDITLPPSMGFATYVENLGKIENKGFELMLNMRVFQETRSRTAVNLFVSASRNVNVIKQISNSLQSYNETQDKTVSNRPSVRFEEGQSMNAIWAVPSLGIDPATGKEIFIKKDGTRTYTWDPADQVVVGENDPKLNGNFGTNILYKGFSFSAAFRFRYGGQVYNQTLVDRVENADIYWNVDTRVFTDRWRKPGDYSLYKDIADRSLTRATSRFVQDINELTLSSVDLSYDFERPFVQKLKLERLRAIFNMMDVFQASTIRIERGLSYPFARVFSFSVQATF